jgi:hypothetical protein
MVVINGDTGINAVQDGTIASSDLATSIALTGVPTAPTPAPGTNNSQIATAAYVDGKRVLGTAVASTSGTSIDFTGIPAWAKRITVMFNEVSTNGTSSVLIQIGNSGGVETSGYASEASGLSNTIGSLASTAGFVLSDNSVAASTYSGNIFINTYGANFWAESAVLSFTGNTKTSVSGGGKTLSGTLSRIRITTVNGTDTFNAGSINIMYEG